MKFIFVVLTVCAFVQTFYCNNEQYPANPSAALSREGSSFFTSDFERYQFDQYIARKNFIVGTVQECSESFRPRGRRENRYIFKYTNWFDGRDRHVTKVAKCLVDCIMRKNAVMFDDGLDEDQYMLQIKELRYNSTYFDINHKSDAEKSVILASLSKLATQLENYDRKKTFESRYYELIQSYAQAANKCKNVKDPNGNTCETSFMVMRCIMRENGKNAFRAPFYPEIN